MVRWEPGAKERLQAAALELFATRGFEQVTAAEIAQSVGLTERTFFRHFSDKREVLFYGQQQFLQAFIDGVDAAPPGASPLEVIASALHTAGSFFPDERRSYARTRQSVIDQNPALRERELHKLAGLATRERHRGAGRNSCGGVRLDRVRNRVRAVDSRRRDALPSRHRIGRAPGAVQPDRGGNRVTARLRTESSSLTTNHLFRWVQCARCGRLA
jgi:AcrR family transcriptional regulator